MVAINWYYFVYYHKAKRWKSNQILKCFPSKIKTKKGEQLQINTGVLINYDSGRFECFIPNVLDFVDKFKKLEYGSLFYDKLVNTVKHFNLEELELHEACHTGVEKFGDCYTLTIRGDNGSHTFKLITKPEIII